MTINEGATCDTCARQGLLNYCRPCSNKIGHRLWEAAPGVEVEIVDQIRFGRNNKIFYDKVRKIKKAVSC